MIEIKLHKRISSIDFARTNRVHGLRKGRFVASFWEGLQKRAARLISDAEIRIVQQRQLIERLRGAGSLTEDAEKTLSAMTNVLNNMRETEAAIRQFRTSHLS